MPIHCRWLHGASVGFIIEMAGLAQKKPLASQGLECPCRHPNNACNYSAFPSFFELVLKHVDYRIEKPGVIKVICKRERVHKPETGAGIPDITGFWQNVDRTVRCRRSSATSLKDRGWLVCFEFASRSKRKEICSRMELVPSIMKRQWKMDLRSLSFQSSLRSISIQGQEVRKLH